MSYLRALGQSWREDTTNSESPASAPRFALNSCPSSNADFSVHIVQRLNDLARLSREERQFWDALVEDRFGSLVRKKSNGAIAITPTGFALSANASARCGPSADTSAPVKSLTERLIRRLYKGARGDYRNLTTKHVEQVIELAEPGTSGQRLDLPGGILVERTFDELIFSARATPGTPPPLLGNQFRRPGVSLHRERPLHRYRQRLRSRARHTPPLESD